MYCTILYVAADVGRDRSYMEIDTIIWYTTFWNSINANSKMVCLVNLGHLEEFDLNKTFIKYTEDNQHSKEPLQIKIQFLKNELELKTKYTI